MDNITINNNTITYRGSEYQYESYEKIDDMCVHIFMGGGIYAFIGNNTTINNILCINADAIISYLPS
jgi:hypothetical protein